MGHFYPASDGRSLPSVTTILKATLPNDQRATIDMWYATQSENSCAKLRKNEESKRRGLAVDAWAKAYLLQQPLPEVDHRFSGQCKQLKPLLERWRQEYDSVLCDRIVYDLHRGYAGTLDIALCKGGKWTIVDIKTRDFIYRPAVDEALLQCCAYGEALATDGFIIDATPRGYLFEIAPIVVTPKKAELVMVDQPDDLNTFSSAWALRLQNYGLVAVA